MSFEKAIIIRDKTRLEQLIERFNSKAQAKFYIESSGGDFEIYENEHRQFYSSLKKTSELINTKFKSKVLDRSFLSTYIFTESDLIVVIGQDGLVANTAKYVSGLPILAINPDPDQYDGVLLPFNVENVNNIIEKLVADNFQIQPITMAEAILNDGQKLLAFNDFYIGAATHVSSRYQITYQGKVENQSSSGVLISTGAGSTGWLSSVFNMAHNVQNPPNNDQKVAHTKLNWDDEKLIFVVREPFLSKTTGIDVGFGTINQSNPLTIESKMPSNGVIFSDGMESDFLNFNSGSSVQIRVSDEKANLISDVL